VILANFLGGRMVWPQSVFQDREGADIQRFRVGVFPLVLIEESEIVEADSGVGMVSP
jgi:hypothetical protein